MSRDVSPVGGGDIFALNGKRLDPMSAESVAKVLVFVDVECPISNRYAPELERIWKKYRSKGLKAYLVYANPKVTPEKIEAHVKSYGFTITALRDPDQVLVRRTGAKVTPEAIVLSKDNEVVYRGRIDNRFPAYGKARPAATKHELIWAIEDVLAGRRVKTATASAVGCYIPKKR